MQSKICTKCKTEKSISEFHKHRNGKFGTCSVCKICACAHTREYNKTHHDERNEKKREFYKANHKKINLAAKVYYKTHSKQIKTKTKEWAKLHPEQVRKISREWCKKRRKIDPMFRLNENTKTDIYHALKGNKKGRHWEDLVGWTLDKFKKHLESLFVEGMSWDNYGAVWHVDHIIPKAAFNFTKPEHRDFKRCWALKNLQPLWAEENFIKNDKLNEHFQPSLLI